VAKHAASSACPLCCYQRRLAGGYAAYHHGMRCLQLRSFEREHLPLVEPWFADAVTQRWLGGPGWPRLMLERAGRPLGEFRGAAETGRYRWLAWDRRTAVGYIDCGTYDRWATWEGGPGGRGVIGTIDVPAGSISYVVDPALRRRGYCVAMVGAVLAMPELEHIQLFVAGVEPANAGSAGCLRRAGFEPLDPEPDWEGIVYYSRLRRPGTPDGPRLPGQPPC
jgi:RimJ/RimL family protein N-acetyltransferase